MALSEPVSVSLVVADIFDSLGVQYLVGGSVASSLLGLPRTTLDADLVADLTLAQVRPFVVALGDEFYADEDAIREAVRRRASFNVIHLATAFKVVVFILRSDPYARMEMSRRMFIRVADQPPRDLAVATAEDTILQKLRRFERGGGVSDRQWNDVLGLIKTRGAGLDREYLAIWAADLGIVGLLQAALAGRPAPKEQT